MIAEVGAERAMVAFGDPRQPQIQGVYGLDAQKIWVGRQVDTEVIHRVLTQATPVRDEGPRRTVLCMPLDAANVSMAPASRALFFLQLSASLDSGLSIPQALDAMTRGEDLSVAAAAEAIMVDVQSGKTLSRSMERLPRAFDKVEVKLVQTGENSGGCSFARVPG